MNKGILSSPRVRFEVADVVPAVKPLPRAALRAVFESGARNKLLICHEAKRRVVEADQFHPLIAAAALAYKHHYPLTLTPDALWLAVLQGVAQHIQNHSETLRSRLVQHRTKIELVIDTDLADLPADSDEMLGLTQAFTERIVQHLQPQKRELLCARFTTTTDVERIAGAVALMDALQPYFDYMFHIVCGIPSVILEGARSDWELLEAKVRALHESDLELSWWTGELLPLCSHFVRAVKGDIDHQHWNNLLKIVERYGADDLNGWLLKFIPYVRQHDNDRPVRQNPVLHLTTFEEPATSEDRTFERITGCTSRMLPSGISSAPVLSKNRASGAELRMQFLAGFAAVTQSSEDLSLKPVISWAITEESRIDGLIAQIRKEYGCPPAKLMDACKLLQIFDYCLPSELWRFFTEIDGVTLTLRRPNCWGERSCEIFPATKVKPLRDLSRAMVEIARDRGIFEGPAFVRLAEAHHDQGTSLYFLGHSDEKHGLIYRWTGELDPEAFTVVAESFVEWLSDLLAANT